MNGPFADEYCQYAFTELETIEVMEAWNVFGTEYDMNVIISICRQPSQPWNNKLLIWLTIADNCFPCQI